MIDRQKSRKKRNIIIVIAKKKSSISYSYKRYYSKKIFINYYKTDHLFEEIFLQDQVERLNNPTID